MGIEGDFPALCGENTYIEIKNWKFRLAIIKNPISGTAYRVVLSYIYFIN